MKRKAISLLLASAMLATALAGCAAEPAGTTTPPTDKTTDQSSTASTESNGDEAPPAASTEPLTLKAFFKTPMPWNTPVSEEITKKTGITMETTPLIFKKAERSRMRLGG